MVKEKFRGFNVVQEGYIDVQVGYMLPWPSSIRVELNLSWSWAKVEQNFGLRTTSQAPRPKTISKQN